MTMPQESDRLFEILATERGHWVEHAESLRLAARPLFSRLMEIGHSHTPRSQVRVEMLGCVRGWMLLQAVAFENLLKAIAVNMQLISTNGRSLQRKQTVQARGGHGLSTIATNLQIGLNPQENGLLRRLEEYLVWAGRYPVPLDASDYAFAHSDGQLKLNETDARLADTMAERLSALALQENS